MSRLSQKRIRESHNRAAFTLIELLIVIAIIGILLTITLPALKVAKRKARDIICRSNLHQWGIVFLTYTKENEDQFWIEKNVWLTGELQGGWMPYLSEFYGNTDKFRLCPSASKPTSPTGGIGTTFTRWGGQIMVNHRFGSDPEKNYGSYGINLWINKVTDTQPGWRGRPDLQWQTTLTKENAATIPMVSDCTWFGTNPDAYNTPGGNPAETRDYWESLPPDEPGNWNRDMARLTIDRHDKAIQMTFMDGSTKKVNLNELWQFNWHRGYPKNHSVRIPWLDP